MLLVGAAEPAVELAGYVLAIVGDVAACVFDDIRAA
jgi:hypothetical protein